MPGKHAAATKYGPPLTTVGMAKLACQEMGALSEGGGVESSGCATTHGTSQSEFASEKGSGTVAIPTAIVSSDEQKLTVGRTVTVVPGASGPLGDTARVYGEEMNAP